MYHAHPAVGKSFCGAGWYFNVHELWIVLRMQEILTMWLV